MSTSSERPRDQFVAVDRTGELQGKGLASDALSLKDSVVIGLASTAPAYSLAATLGYIILAVGEFSAASILVAFVPMLFTAYAYRELNRAVPDCGTTFTWSTKAFGPWIGWMGGWGVAFAGTIFLANAAEVAARYFLSALNEMGLSVAGDWAESTVIVTSIGVASIVAVGWISYRGIEISARIQNLLIYFQYGVMILFTGALLWPVLSEGVPDGGISLSLSMLDPFKIDSTQAMIAAVVLGVFLFWGWDTTLSINEETEDSDRIPGRSAIISTLILLVTYVGVTVAVLAAGGIGEGALDFSDEAVAAGSADDVFTPLAASVGVWLAILVELAIVVSSLSSSQTTIMPTSRGMLSMGVYRAVPQRFAVVHDRFKSPSFSTAVMCAAAIVYYVGMTVISQNLLYDSIYSIGLAITFYYALTGFSCVWYFRHDLTRSVGGFVTRGLLPLLGAVALTFVFLRSAADMYDPENNYTTLFGVGAAFVLGIGGLLLGVVLMIALSFVPDLKPFFHGVTLTRETPVLVPETDHAVVIATAVTTGGGGSDQRAPDDPAV
jgi:amino acid transporter